MDHKTQKKMSLRRPAFHALLRGPVAGIATCIGAAVLHSAGALAQDVTPPVSGASVTQPLWEAGIAAVAGTVPDYPAAGHSSIRVLPLPYFVYRGAYLRADQEGARARTQLRSNVELEVSFGGSLASHTGGSGPREGMPNLDYLAEVGPNLKVILAHPSESTILRLDLPVRAVISAGDHWGYRGVLTAPSIGVYDRSLLGSTWEVSAAIGPVFTTSQYQKYFYQVDPQYARPGRPAYEASGGYLGTRLNIGINHSITRNVRIFGYCRIENQAGSSSEDSPLFRTQWSYTAFIGASWSFLESKRSVIVPVTRP